MCRGYYTRAVLVAWHWREELLCRSRDNHELRLFTTTLPAEQRLVTWMHDPVYRLGVAWQNVAHNQPAHPRSLPAEEP